MAGEMRSLVLVYIFIGLLMSGGRGSEEDVHCLKVIKSSLIDPFGHLISWNFSDTRVGMICRFVGVTCWNDADDKVLSIELSKMRLKGDFPTGIRYCRSLTKLDLSDNLLSGPIPPDIANLIPYVTNLDLSSNNFSGQVPGNMANCSYLNVLRLNHNRLTGNLPKELRLLSRMRKFNVSFNLLSGPVPDFAYSSILKNSYAHNQQLCGGPLDPCLLKRQKKSDNSFTLGFVIGYELSFAAAIVCFSVLSLQLKTIIRISLAQSRSRRKEEDQLIHCRALNNIKQIPKLENLISKMSIAQLWKATNYFSDDNVIGIGRTGTMYRATLPNGWFLAVKRLHDPEQSEGQFVSEILALSKMRHENLIPLLGFCIDNNDKLLVYKYMSNGNLFDCLHSARGETKLLQWPVRVKIAIGIARGLAWLHHKCVYRVVHRKISSRGVLLDRFFEAKISNFGSSIISNDGGAMVVYRNESDSGSLVNNEAWDSHFVKKDVYDYGIVLLELITGKETKTGSSVTSLHNTLVKRTNHVSTSTVMFNDDIDKHLIGQGFDSEILQLLRLASDCVHPHAYERPTMLKAYERVSNLGHRYGILCDYGMVLQPRRWK